MSLDVTPLSPFAYRLAAHSSLGQPELAALLSLNGPIVRIVSNRDFVRAGEIVGNAAFIVSGLVGSFGQKRDGARQITALHLPGDMANLHSVAVPEASEALQAPRDHDHLGAAQRASRARRMLPEAGRAILARERPALGDDGPIAVNLGRSNALGSVAHLICEVTCRTSEPVARRRLVRIPRHAGADCRHARLHPYPREPDTRLASRPKRDREIEDCGDDL